MSDTYTEIIRLLKLLQTTIENTSIYRYVNPRMVAGDRVIGWSNVTAALTNA